MLLLTRAYGSEPPTRCLVTNPFLAPSPRVPAPPAQQCERRFRLLRTQLVFEERKLPCKHGPGHRGNGASCSVGMTSRAAQGQAGP